MISISVVAPSAPNSCGWARRLTSTRLIHPIALTVSVAVPCGPLASLTSRRATAPSSVLGAGSVNGVGMDVSSWRDGGCSAAAERLDAPADGAAARLYRAGHRDDHIGRAVTHWA